MEGKKINMSRIEFFGLESKECSQCGNLHAVSSMYFNKKEGNLWCLHCLGKVKKKRNHRQWDKNLGRRSKKNNREDEK